MLSALFQILQEHRFQLASLICSKASYTIICSILLLIKHYTVDKTCNDFQVYNGSANTSRLGALFYDSFLSYLHAYPFRTFSTVFGGFVYDQLHLQYQVPGRCGNVPLEDLPRPRTDRTTLPELCLKYLGPKRALIRLLKRTRANYRGLS